LKAIKNQLHPRRHAELVEQANQVLSPIVSTLWIGRREPVFVASVTILAAGWLVNVLSNPAYVVGLGSGSLRAILAGCILTTALNGTLGWIAGRYFGATTIVAASAFSLAAGYAIVVASYHVERRIPFAVLIPKESGPILLSCGAALAIFLVLDLRLATAPVRHHLAT
jgi:hypothetical protein